MFVQLIDVFSIRAIEKVIKNKEQNYNGKQHQKSKHPPRHWNKD